MPYADWVGDAVTVVAIVTACGLAWLSVRVPNAKLMPARFTLDRRS